MTDSPGISPDSMVRIAQVGVAGIYFPFSLMLQSLRVKPYARFFYAALATAATVWYDMLYRLRGAAAPGKDKPHGQ